MNHIFTPSKHANKLFSAFGVYSDSPVHSYEEDEYYKPPGLNPWQIGRYENFEVRYNREPSFSPYRVGSSV